MDDLPERHLSPLRHVATVVRTDLVRLLRDRRAPGLALVQLMPVCAALLLVHVWSFDGLSIYTSLVQYVEFPLVVPIVAIFYGGPVLVNEVEGRTLTFLTLRPVPKPILYLGKWLAGALVSLALVLVPLLLIFAICLASTGSLTGSGVTVGKTLLAASLGVLTYSALFAALGALFSTHLVAGIVYFVIVEMVMGSIPTLELVTVRFHLRSIAGFGGAGSGEGLETLIPGGSVSPAWWTSALVVAGLGGLALIVGALIFKHREYHV